MNYYRGRKKKHKSIYSYIGTPTITQSIISLHVWLLWYNWYIYFVFILTSFYESCLVELIHKKQKPGIKSAHLQPKWLHLFFILFNKLSFYATSDTPYPHSLPDFLFIFTRVQRTKKQKNCVCVWLYLHCC